MSSFNFTFYIVRDSPKPSTQLNLINYQFIDPVSSHSKQSTKQKTFFLILKKPIEIQSTKPTTFFFSATKQKTARFPQLQRMKKAAHDQQCILNWKFSNQLIKQQNYNLSQSSTEFPKKIKLKKNKFDTFPPMFEYRQSWQFDSSI